MTAQRPVVGLEIHLRLATQSKLFCPCPADATAPANSCTCAVCLGFPGALPVPNAAALRLGVRLALALGCEVAPVSRWARKSYFYPDLPKGYQVTQAAAPLARGGAIGGGSEDGTAPDWPLERLHLEEDAGKSFHDDPADPEWAIDFNRCGVPLAEIVTAPRAATPEQAARAVARLQALARALAVSDADMEKGSLRVDANVSLARADGAAGERVEIKNLNSLRALRRALAHEADRQAALVAAGGCVARETRGWDDAAGVTRPQRGKEETADYRFLDEPDLPPVVADAALRAAASAAMPELPDARAARYAGLGLSAADARRMADDALLGVAFDAALLAGGGAAACARWLLDLPGARAAAPAALAALSRAVAQEAITAAVAKHALLAGTTDPLARARAEIAGAPDDAALDAACRAAIDAHPREAQAVREGRGAVLEFLVGQALQRAGRGTDARAARARLAALLATP